LTVGSYNGFMKKQDFFNDKSLSFLEMRSLQAESFMLRLIRFLPY